MEDLREQLALTMAEAKRRESDALTREQQKLLKRVRQESLAAAKGGVNSASFGLFVKFSLEFAEKLMTTVHAMCADVFERFSYRIDPHPMGSSGIWVRVEMKWPESPEPPPPKRRRVSNFTACCGVCTETKPASCLVPCGHLICTECSDRAVGEDENKRCPWCREAVLATQVIFAP